MPAEPIVSIVLISVLVASSVLQAGPIQPAVHTVDR